MFEESPDGFVTRWREYASPVRIFSRTEGQPLIECQVGPAILQMLERSGPYLAQPGEGKAIINPTVDRVEETERREQLLEATGVGCARGCGVVVSRDDPFLVVDVGAPLVIGVHEPLPAQLAQGDWVSFEAIPPIHAFVVPEPRGPLSRAAEADAL